MAQAKNILAAAAQGGFGVEAERAVPSEDMIAACCGGLSSLHVRSPQARSSQAPI